MRRATIGIACRNEENNITTCLQSIEISAKNFGIPDIDVIVCLNNCTDMTESRVLSFMKFTKMNIKLVSSEGNIIDAQRKIWGLSKSKPVVFIDADTHIPETAIKSLVSGLSSGTVVSYLPTKHSYVNKNALLSRVHRLYANGDFLTAQHFFHGRAFAISDWNIPTHHEVKERASGSSKFLLGYGGGLMTDDIALSTYVLDKYGLNAIKKIPIDSVHSNAVSKWEDWFKTHRRIAIEVKKINDWFPEWRHLKKIRRRRTDWGKWLDHTGGNRYVWVVYVLIERLWNVRINAEFLAVRCGLIKAPDQWKVPLSTKRKLDIDIH